MALMMGGPWSSQEAGTLPLKLPLPLGGGGASGGGELQGGLLGTLVAMKVQYGLQAPPGKGPGRLLLRAAHCCPSACVSDTQAPRTDGIFRSGYARRLRS